MIHKLSVDNVWLDEATRQLEFVGVQTGWLGLGKTHLIPAADAQVDDASRTIQTMYDEEQIKGAPSYGAQVELTPDDENRVYSYYGLQRATAPSPTGLASATGTAAAGATGGTSTASGQAGGYVQDGGDITLLWRDRRQAAGDRIRGRHCAAARVGTGMHA